MCGNYFHMVNSVTCMNVGTSLNFDKHQITRPAHNNVLQPDNLTLKLDQSGIRIPKVTEPDRNRTGMCLLHMEPNHWNSGAGRLG